MDTAKTIEDEGFNIIEARTVDNDIDLQIADVISQIVKRLC